MLQRHCYSVCLTHVQNNLRNSSFNKVPEEQHEENNISFKETYKGRTVLDVPMVYSYVHEYECVS